MKTIDTSTFDALTTHSKIQTSKEASAQDFGIDIEQDLVRALTGTPKDETLGQSKDLLIRRVTTGLRVVFTCKNGPYETMPEEMRLHQKSLEQCSQMSGLTSIQVWIKGRD